MQVVKRFPMDAYHLKITVKAITIQMTKFGADAPPRERTKKRLLVTIFEGDASQFGCSRVLIL